MVKQDFKSLYLGSHDKALISGSSSSSSSPSSSGKRPGSSSTKGSKDRKVLDGITSFSSVAPDERGTWLQLKSVFISDSNYEPIDLGFWDREDANGVAATTTIFLNLLFVNQAFNILHT